MSHCSQFCECENKPENWRCCSECQTAVCDFNDIPLDWYYDDEEEVSTALATAGTPNIPATTATPANCP